MAELCHADRRLPCAISAQLWADAGYLGLVLDSWRVYDRRVDAPLLLSELVTMPSNDVVYGVDLVVLQPEDQLRVEVFDDDVGKAPLLRDIEPSPNRAAEFTW